MPVFNQSRSRIIRLIFLAAFFLILAQLFHLQILSKEYIIDAKRNAIFEKRVYPSRGIIFDRKNNPILTNTMMFGEYSSSYADLGAGNALTGWTAGSWGCGQIYTYWAPDDGSGVPPNSMVYYRFGSKHAGVWRRLSVSGCCTHFYRRPRSYRSAQCALRLCRR